MLEYFGLYTSKLFLKWTFDKLNNIFLSKCRSEKRMRQHASAQTTIPNNQRHTDGSTQLPNSQSKISEQREAKQKRNEWRITKMVLAIFLSFLACYLPITITKVVDTDVNWPGLHIFGYIMIYMSACINPIIYVIMNKQYRTAYKTVLLCKASRLLSFTNGGSSHGGM